VAVNLRNSSSLCNIAPNTHAHECNTTNGSSLNSTCTSCNNNEGEFNTPSCINTNNSSNDNHGTTSSATTPAIATEHPSVHNVLSSVDDAERGNLLRDMTSKLVDKISSKYRELTEKQKQAVVTSHTGDSAIQVSLQEVLMMGDLSQQLQFFVEHVNESLHRLGTTPLTQQELQLLLATAPLPSMGSNNNDIRRLRSNSATEGLSASKTDPENGRHRSLSTSEGAISSSSSCKSINLINNNRRLSHSASEGVNKLNIAITKKNKLSFSSELVDRQQQQQNEEGEAEISPRRHPTQQHSDSVKDQIKKESPQRRLSTFISKKMESFTNLLDNMEPEEGASSSPARRNFTKTKSFQFGSSSVAGSTKSSDVLSGSVTPSTGCSTPKNFADYGCDFVDGMMTADDVVISHIKNKLEMVEKALCDEVVNRTEAENKVVSLEQMICQMSTELKRAQKHNETVTEINNQMGVELRLLRQRNSSNVVERQQVEDALVGETKKRRVLEAQIQMLIKTFQEKNVKSTSTQQEFGIGSVSPRQQEFVLAQQREEVLLAVIEGMRLQMEAAEVEKEHAKTEWADERARYQEVHDLLRFQIDQLVMKNNAPPPQPSEFEQKVDEVVTKYSSAGRCLSHTVSVHNLKEQANDTQDCAKGKVTTENEDSNEICAESCHSPALSAIPSLLRSPLSPPQLSVTTQEPSRKMMSYTQRMKLFFLSTFWWPNFDVLKIENSAQPLRCPILLLQIAWWVAELREYVTDNHLNLRFVPHSNQFCNCDDCVASIASYAMRR